MFSENRAKFQRILIAQLKHSARRRQSHDHFDYKARVISWWFCVNIFWNAMHLAQNVDHKSRIQEFRHLAFHSKIYIAS